MPASPGGPTPRRPRLPLFAALALAAGLLLAPLPPAWARGWRAELLDLGHVPLFAGLVVAIRAWAGGPPWRAAVAGVGLAGLAELAQAFAGRSATWPDFLNGALGSLAAGAAILSRRAARRPVRVGSAFLALALLVWPLDRSAPVLLDAAEGHRDFPTLAAFRTDRELRRWELRQAILSRDPDPARPGEWVGRLELLPGREDYPSGTLRPVVGDFAGYRWLCCSFGVAGGPLELVISVRGGPEHDGHTTHSQAGGTYPPGEHVVRLELADVAAKARPVPLDPADVRAVQFFAVRPAEPRAVRLRRVWLEP